jgi:hypothetical protein
VAKTFEVVLNAFDGRSARVLVECITRWSMQRIKGGRVVELEKMGGEEKRRKRIKGIYISQKIINGQRNAFHYLHTPLKYSK